MAIKKQLAPIGLNPTEAKLASGVQSIAVLQYTKLLPVFLIQNQAIFWLKKVVICEQVVNGVFDKIYHLIHIIIGSHV